MKFKVGDKAKIIMVDFHCKQYKNKIGTVIEIDRIKNGYSSRWDYRIELDDNFTYLFSDEEIEKVIQKGQLVFSFMEGE